MRRAQAAERPRRGIQAIALGRRPPRPARSADRDGCGDTLRSPAFIDYGDRKLQAQFKIADRNGARYALILGSDELAAGRASSCAT